MASLRAHLYAFTVRRVVRPRLGTMEDIAQVRRIFGGASFPDPPGVAYTAGTLGGIPGEWVSAETARPDRAPARVLYLHGGGFVACSAKTHRPVTGALARRGLTIFAPDYRLAPEHPFPAAIEDAAAVWTALLRPGAGSGGGRFRRRQPLAGADAARPRWRTGDADGRRAFFRRPPTSSAPASRTGRMPGATPCSTRNPC